jgi:hypothetical protein
MKIRRSVNGLGYFRLYGRNGGYAARKLSKGI